MDPKRPLSTPGQVKRWLIFVLACLLFLLSQFYRASVAVISPELIAELSLDTGQLSFISAAFFYAFALMQIPISMYLDGIGPRLSMTVLSLVSVLGAVVFATGHSAAQLAAGRVLMGIGMACNLMGTLKLITLWFTPRYFATLSALVASTGTFGNLIAATPLVLTAQAFGWRNAFLLIGAGNLVLALLFLLIVRDRPADAGPEVPKAASTGFGEIAATLRQLFGKKDYWIISLGTFSRYGIFAAVQALWAGPFLIQVLGVPAVDAGNLLLLASLGVIIGSPLSGWLSDSLLRNRKKIIVMGLIGMAAVLGVFTRLSGGSGMGLLSALFFCFGLFGSTGGIMYAHIKESMPPESAGAAMTGINFFTMFGSAVFLQGLGNLMYYLHPDASLGRAAFQDAFLLCAGFLLLTTVAYLFTVETLGRNKKN